MIEETKKQINAICEDCGKDRGIPQSRAVFGSCADCLNKMEMLLRGQSNTLKKKLHEKLDM